MKGNPLKRRQLIELEDLPWWPSVFRDACTDYLQTVMQVVEPYESIVPRLAAAIHQCRATVILDLCSGAGGPWRQLLPALHAEGCEIRVRLSDKFPNVRAYARVVQDLPGIEGISTSVDARAVPAGLAEFRTLFTGFHHFRPPEAQAVLAAAVRDRCGIAVYELTHRSWGAVLRTPFVPLVVWLVTPIITPFRWSRLFWTYLVPVIPFTILFDGLVSCLRTYTTAELQAMVDAIDADQYQWEIGVEQFAGGGITYLIGVPEIR